MSNGINSAPTFVVGEGNLITDLGAGASTDCAQSVVVQADGKILVGGYSSNGVDYDFALVRYNADGSLDTSFSGDGRLTTAVGSGDDNAISVLVQPDGGILLAGYGLFGGDNDFALVRYHPDGSLDSGFSGDGIASADFTASGDSDSGFDIVLAPDGDIVMVGSTYFLNTAYPYYPYYRYDYDLALARFNADGSLDTEFSGDGLLTTPGSGSDEQGYSIALQADGKYLVAGSTYSWSGTRYDYDLILLRYNADGSLDTGFSGDGIARIFDSSYDQQAYSVAVQADGKILVGGYGWGGSFSYNDFLLYRFNADGSLDTSFSYDGKVLTNFGLYNHETGNSVIVQPDGKILVAGTSRNGSYYDFALVRYNADGSLDTSFSGDGRLTTGYSLTIDSMKSVALQADGKILVSGYGWNGVNTDFALLRYNSDGTLDLSFNGANTLDGAPVFIEGGAAVVLDADARIYDAELSAAGNYAGASLTLSRHGGASGDDRFEAAGAIASLAEGGNLVVSGTLIGTVTRNSGGTLVLTFSGSATNSLVDAALQSIAYSNSAGTPPALVQIDWTFSDGNGSAQGTGGTLAVTGSTSVILIAANDAAHAFTGTAGSDAYDGRPVADRFYGLTGNDTLSGHGGADLLDGGDGDDGLDGGPGNDTLNGGAGNDLLSGGAGNDLLYGSHGADFFSRTAGEGNDTLVGGAGDDMFYFGASQGVTGAAGSSLAWGNAGNDWIFIDIGSSAGLGLGTLQVHGGAGEEMYAFITGYVTGGNFDPDSIPELTAFSLPALSVADFTPGAGGDLIFLSYLLEISAGSANGYSGGNPFDPALGYLRLSQSGADTLLEWDMDGASGGSHAFQTIMVLENLSAASLGADNFSEKCPPDGSSASGGVFGGNVYDDALRGSYADDFIYGFLGNDTLAGYAGNDTLYGGIGDDLLRGWAGNDTLYGEAGNDTLYGNRGDDLADGGDGDDIFAHGAGNGSDTLVGGLGNDTFNVTSGSASGAAEAVRIYGDGGSDIINVAIAGTPAGTLLASGGSGQDIYNFLTPEGAQPGLTVTDFAAVRGGDIVSLATLLNASASGGNGYAGGNPFNAALGYLRLRQSGADTLLEWDRDGAAGSAHDFQTVMVMQGVTASSLASGNFTESCSPTGSEAAGVARIGTSGGDALTGQYTGDTLSGGGGNDFLWGSAGADSLDGGLGDDILWEHSGNDSLVGSDGHDILNGGLGDDSVAGGSGTDLLLHFSGEGSDSLDGGAGDDLFYFVAGSVQSAYLGYFYLQHLQAGGAAGETSWFASGGFEAAGETVAVAGGDGQDQLWVDIGAGWSAADTINASGGGGQDEFGFYYSGSNARADGLVTLPTLVVGDFTAGAGGDWFNLNTLLEVSALVSSDGGAADSGSGAALPSGASSYSGGNPFANGGSGHFRFLQSGGDTLFQWDRDGSAGSAWDYQTVMVLLNVQASAINAHNFKPVVSSGTAGDDLIWGGLGADTLAGGDGNDDLDGNLGPDSLEGGQGADTYHVDDAGDIVTESSNTPAGSQGFQLGVDLSSTIDTVVSSINYALGSYLENLTLTTTANLTGVGNDLDNLLTGNTGNNTLTGGAGNDTLAGGNGKDTASYAGATAAVSVSLASTAAQNTGGAGTDTLSGIENLLGSNYNDTLTGSAGANALTGGTGNDTLEGGTGTDTLTGGSGSDTASYASASAAVSVSLTLTAAQNTGGAGSDKLAGIEHLTGSGFNDTLTGSSGANRLTGGAGSDVLNGMGGSDTLGGGSGADSFVLAHPFTSDTVTDFTSGSDTIRIKMSAIRIADGDTAVEGATIIAGPGGFATAAELVLVTADIGGAINATSASAAIGSASSTYAAGAKRLFAVDNGASSALFLFTSSAVDAAVSAAELTQLASLSGTAATALGDYVFVA